MLIDYQKDYFYELDWGRSMIQYELDFDAFETWCINRYQFVLDQLNSM